MRGPEMAPNPPPPTLGSGPGNPLELPDVLLHAR
jgi:hypothetical protein